MSVSSITNAEVQSSLASETKRKRRHYDSMANPPQPGAFKLRPAAFYLIADWFTPNAEGIPLDRESLNYLASLRRHLDPPLPPPSKNGEGEAS